jgi:D-beta-D-heptose 7-phosphate kinase/D-beta-D-heptose 1-phosphate adenosyltransferase
MKVIVIGDVIYDVYIHGTSTRISPEAPVPVVNYQSETTTHGGAGLVFENLKSLGVNTTLFDSGQPASQKTRIISDGHYITRVDNDNYANAEEAMATIYYKDFSEYDIAVLSDYGKGVLGRSKEIIDHLLRYDLKIIVDPKNHQHNYEGAWLVKPNQKEMVDYNFNKWKGNIITTNAGKDVTATIDNKQYTVPVTQVEVNDVTGAGDCFIAAFVYALTKEYDYEKCLQIAVNASTESVKHSGTYIVKEEDLQKRVIFTNGCFDILHKGHLSLLKQARELGDKLIVGLNTDASVKRLKGDERPVNDQTTRKEQLELISYVDEVVLFDEDTPYELINKLKPDLIVKGGDYTVEEIVGHDLAPVHIVPTVESYSTSDTIKRIME